MTLEAIKTSIPHREPFLLVDEVIEQSESRIICRKRFTGAEFWYGGHYPEFPLTPGVLLCEAAMQAGAVLIAGRVGRGDETHQNADGGSRASTHPTQSSGVPVATRMNNVKFRNMVRPGDTIEMKVELVEQLADAYFLKAAVTVDSKTAVTFDFACKLAEPPNNAS